MSMHSRRQKPICRQLVETKQVDVDVACASRQMAAGVEVAGKVSSGGVSGSFDD